jgi:hypothetical protein
MPKIVRASVSAIRPSINSGTLGTFGTEVTKALIARLR